MRVDGVASEIKDRERALRLPRPPAAPLHPAGGGPQWHRDDRPLALHLGDPGATAGAAAEMVFHQDAAAAAQLVAQIRAEVRPELRTGGAAGVRRSPRRAPARPRACRRPRLPLSSPAVLVPDGLRTSPTFLSYPRGSRLYSRAASPARSNRVARSLRSLASYFATPCLAVAIDV